LSTALKKGLLTEEDAKSLFEHMSRLNKKPADLLKQYVVHAVTDVTGFGLLGHLHEITGGSSVDAEIWYEEVGFMDKARELLASKVIPGGTANNLEYIRKYLKPGKGVGENNLLMLADAQTSGGLLFTLPKEDLENIKKEFLEAGENFFVIGKMMEKGKGDIYIEKENKGEK